MPDWILYLLAFVLILVGFYILVRFGSIAYFRTKAEFEARKPKFIKGEHDAENERT